MGYHTQKHVSLPSQLYEIAEEYRLGHPVTEHHPIFLRREVISLIRCIFFLILLIMATISFKFSLVHPVIGEIVLYAFCGVALWGYWIVDVVSVFHSFQNLAQRRISLLVCQEGFLYAYDSRVEVVLWQQIQRYALAQPGISRRITINCTDGRQFQVDDRLGNFGNFLWRLTCHLMARDQAIREYRPLPLPKVFRLTSAIRKISVLLGGIAVIEGMLWMIAVSDFPLFARIFGFLQLLILWIILVTGLMLWLRRRLVSKLQVVLSQEGVTYDSYNYSIYTPWQNIVSVQDMLLSTRVLLGLRLQTPVRQDMTVKEGREQGIAVFEIHHKGWTNHFRKHFPFTNVFPLDISLLGACWLQGEFAQYLRTYAPQICDENE